MQSKLILLVISLAIIAPDTRCGQLVPASKPVSPVIPDGGHNNHSLFSPRTVALAGALCCGGYCVYRQWSKREEFQDKDPLQSNKSMFQRLKEAVWSFFFGVKKDNDNDATRPISRATETLFADDDEKTNGPDVPNQERKSGPEVATHVTDHRLQLSNKQQTKLNEQLHKAAGYYSSFHEEEIEAIVHKGAQIDSLNQYGETVLHVAATQEKSSRIQFLLDLGARVDVKDRRGNTPLMEAAKGGWFEAITVLLKKRACVSDKKDVEKALAMAKKYLNISSSTNKSHYDKSVKLLEEYIGQRARS